ncbi:hypothetical protein [Desulfosporosinus sp. SB140]|uniref:hypothetical protein n=1 Tax=Desulfosporosinus paludis TaxID=3115649 RepID=UPI00388E6679
MRTAVGIYALIYGGFIIIALFSWFIWDKRYRKNHGTVIPKGYVATEEVFVDPVSGTKLKVYYDPQTGNRFYRET